MHTWLVVSDNRFWPKGAVCKVMRRLLFYSKLFFALNQLNGYHRLARQVRRLFTVVPAYFFYFKFKACVYHS